MRICRKLIKFPSSVHPLFNSHLSQRSAFSSHIKYKISKINQPGKITPLTSQVKVEVSPNSVGNRLKEKALIFGGSVLTTSDIATGYLKADLGDGSKVRLPPNIIKQANKQIQDILEDGVDQMKVRFIVSQTIKKNKERIKLKKIIYLLVVLN